MLTLNQLSGFNVGGGLSCKPSAASDYTTVASPTWGFSGSDIYNNSLVNEAIYANTTYLNDFVLEWTWTSGTREDFVGFGSASASLTVSNTVDPWQPVGYPGRFGFIYMDGVIRYCIPGGYYNDTDETFTVVGTLCRLQRVSSIVQFYTNNSLRHTFTGTSLIPIKFGFGRGNSGSNVYYTSVKVCSN